MAEYSRITDPSLQARAAARYVAEIASLERIGFRHLAYSLEALGPFSALFQLPVLLLTLPKREILAFPPPLRLAVANVLLASLVPSTIALCMGMGVKLYTGFLDDTILISSTFQSHAVPAPTSAITKSQPFPTVELAWSGHKDRLRELERQGRVVRPNLSFEHYVAMSHREEDLSQYL
jgi:hypothetical protein